MGYIPTRPEQGRMLDVTSLESLEPEYAPSGFITTSGKINQRTAQQLRARWEKVFGLRPSIEPTYDPGPLLRQAMFGYVLLVALVLSAAAVVWSLVTGWGW